jgi:hypothetical protein
MSRKWQTISIFAVSTALVLMLWILVEVFLFFQFFVESLIYR